MSVSKLLLYLGVFALVSMLLILLALGFPEWLVPYTAEQDKLAQLDIIFWKLRFPRVILAFLVGAALAVGGVVFQSLFRNPLASPYTLGVSSGAALGVALLLLLQGSLITILPISLTFAALIGALLTAFIILAIISRARLSAESSILVGVVLNLFFSSLILLIQYLSDQTQLLHITRWLMGSISIVGWEQLVVLLAVLVLVLPWIYTYADRLDLLAFGDETAQAQGVAVRKSYIMLVALVSLLTASVVSIVGPIGFIGIVVPHYMRLLGFRIHRDLLLAAIIAGGLFLAVCDTVARSVVFPFEVPVGVVTALIGSPLFLHILIQRKRNSHP